MIVTVEEMATKYWSRMRRASLKEIETRLAQLRTGSPATLRYWLAVYEILEKKSLLSERKLRLVPQQVSI